MSTLAAKPNREKFDAIGALEKEIAAVPLVSHEIAEGVHDEADDNDDYLNGNCDEGDDDGDDGDDKEMLDLGAGGPAKSATSAASAKAPLRKVTRGAIEKQLAKDDGNESVRNFLKELDAEEAHKMAHLKTVSEKIDATEAVKKEHAAAHTRIRKSINALKRNLRPFEEEVVKTEEVLKKATDDIVRSAVQEKLVKMNAELGKMQKRIDDAELTDVKWPEARATIAALEKDKKEIEERLEKIAVDRAASLAVLESFAADAASAPKKAAKAASVKTAASKVAVAAAVPDEEDDGDDDDDDDDDEEEEEEEEAAPALAPSKKRKAGASEDEPAAEQPAKAAAASAHTNGAVQHADDKRRKTHAVHTEQEHEHECVNWMRAAPVDYGTRHRMQPVEGNQHHSLDVGKDVKVLGTGYQILFHGSEMTYLLVRARAHLLQALQFGTSRAGEKNMSSPLLWCLLSNSVGGYADAVEGKASKSTLKVEQQLIKRIEKHISSSRKKESAEKRGFEAFLEDAKTRHAKETEVLGDSLSRNYSNTASILWDNMRTALNGTDLVGRPMYDANLLRSWLLIIALSFLHPTETLYKAGDYVPMLTERYALQKECPSLLDKLKAKDEEWATMQQQDDTELLVNTLPFGRHLTAREYLLYLVRVVLEAMYKTFVIPRAAYYRAVKDGDAWNHLKEGKPDAQKMDEAIEALEKDRELNEGPCTGDEADGEGSFGELEESLLPLTPVMLTAAVFSRLAYERHYSDRMHTAKYAMNQHRWYNTRVVEHKARGKAEVLAWLTIRRELYCAVHEPSDELRQALQSQETCFFVNTLFPFHY